jgi:hypothetical protein
LLCHYDAHFYIANWGTVRLGLALPAASLPREAVEPYLRGGERHEDTLTLKQVGDRCIVWWERNEEGGWWQTQGEGGIDELIGVREEILRGDYRALFLGWLADFRPDEWTNAKDKRVLLPPVPGGLDRLSPPQAALIRHFPVDRDALDVAASLSRVSTSGRIPIATVVSGLPVSELRMLLERVAEGEGSKVMAELNRLAIPPPATTGVSTLNCMDFAAQIREVRDARHKEEARVEAAQRKRESEARRQRLASVMERADTIWAGLDPLMDQKATAAYDQAAAQLTDLRDAHEQAGAGARFRQKLTAFRERYARRQAMLRRIEEL